MKLPLSLAAFAFIAAPSLSAQVLSIELIASGVIKPTHLAEDPTQPGRLFVVERNRGIDVIIDGVLQSTPFLDLSAEVDTGTQGIMGIAMHPDYGQNGHFYLVYTDMGQMSHVVEYTVSADPNVADPASRVQIVGPEAQPGVVHNWNLPMFGPDGMLYITTGDGVLSSTNTTNLAQDLGSIFGKMLRLDVDLPAPYIPADNPYVGMPGAREEIFLCGLRQPWRFDFDPLTGDLWVADVGDNSNEEVTFLPAGTAAGANLGWKCQIGREDCDIGIGCSNCDDPSFTRPAWDYQHVSGHCAIIGGGVYRGADIPWLQGKYLFADYCSGDIWSMRANGTRVYDWVEHTLPVTNPGVNLVTSFARLLNGELLILDHVGGEIWKIVAGDNCGASGGQLTCPATVNSTGYVSVLGATGSLTVSDNDLRLYVGNVPANQFGYMLMSQSAGNVPMFGGSQGTLCLGAPIVRFSQDVLTADMDDGTVLFQPDLANLPNNVTIQPGDSWIFQYWFRDANPTPTSNTSDAVVVTFCP